MKRNLALLIVALFLSGCFATFTEKHVVTTQPSFHGNLANSGILEECNDNGCPVDLEFLTDHGFKPADAGVTKEGDHFVITGELMVKAISMDAKRKNPTKK